MRAQLGLFTPAPPASLVAGLWTPRDYQIRADLAIDREHAIHRATAIEHACGTGKTSIFSMQAIKRGSALILVHRDMLGRQAQERLMLASGKEVTLEKGELRAHEAPYIVASVQSLHPGRLLDFKRRFPHFDLIITDEGHRGVAKSYRNVYDAYPESKLLFVSATFDRSDGIGMKNVVTSLADSYGVIQATNDGWLTPIKFQPVKAQIDLSKVSVVGSGQNRDYNQEELDSAVVREAGRIAESCFRAVAESENPTGRVIGFAPGVRTSHAAAAAMNELRPGCALVVDSEMDPALKRATIERFKAGEAQYLWNCNIMTEGADDPELYATFDASPTKSRPRAVQRWGRPSRLHPLVAAACRNLHTPELRRAAIANSPKPWALVFDLVANSDEHDVELVDKLDILDGRELPPEIRKEANRILRNEGGTPAAAIDRAEEEAASKKRRAAAARHLAQATSVTMGKPRSVFERAGLEFIKRKQVPGRPQEAITPKMWGLLKKRGIPFPRDCTIPQFKRLLSLDRKQEAKGFCRLGGVEWLRMYGVDGWKLPSATAKRIRDAISANGRKLTAEELAPLMERTPGED